MDKIYCDTCVYIDLFEGRHDRFNCWDEFALSLFNRVREKEYTLVISDWLLEELKKRDHDETFTNFIKEFEKNNLIRVETTAEDRKKARALSSSNYPDALHVVLAKKADAVYLVTRDIHYFSEFRDVIEISLPQSL